MVTSEGNKKSSGRIRSAKPEWHKSLARFIQQFDSSSMEKDNYYLFAYLGVGSTGRLLPKAGSIDRNVGEISPDNFVLRQSYLRSYKFTTQDDAKKNKFYKMMNRFVGKTKKWFKDKEKVMKGPNKKTHILDVLA